jgi:hypothetical protein
LESPGWDVVVIVHRLGIVKSGADIRREANKALDEFEAEMKAEMLKEKEGNLQLGEFI